MRALALVALLAAFPGRVVLGQWYVGLDLASGHYGGSARDTSHGSGPPVFRPGDASMVGVHVERVMGRLGVLLRAATGTPGLAGAGSDLTVTNKSLGDLIEVATLVTVRVGGIGPSGAIRAELGPALHLWNLGDEVRAPIGALGALAYQWPVAGRFSGAIRLEGAVSKSWFEEGDLPPEYELRLTWRYGVTLGLRYRL